MRRAHSPNHLHKRSTVMYSSFSDYKSNYSFTQQNDLSVELGRTIARAAIEKVKILGDVCGKDKLPEPSVQEVNTFVSVFIQFRT